MRKITPMPKELILEDDSYWGVSSSNENWKHVDKNGYILEIKRFNEVPKQWNEYISQRCACMEIHTKKVSCVICNKKDYSLYFYPAEKNHYCIKHLGIALSKHNKIMREDYGILPTEEFNKKIEKDIKEIAEKLNKNPIMRIVKFLGG